MSIESSVDRLPLYQVESEVERVRSFTYSLYDLKEECKSISDQEDRELMLGMCEDIATTSQRYVKIVASFYDGTAMEDEDFRRRRAHESIISSLAPLVRYLGGNYQKWWGQSTIEGGLSGGDRKRIGEWALVEGLEILRGEELERVKPR